MSEEEIIENVKQTIEEYEEVIREEQEKGNVEDVESGTEIKQAIQGLLDLYTKQKQNIDKLQKDNKRKIKIIDLLIDDFQLEGYLQFESKDNVLSYYNRRINLEEGNE